MLVCLIVGCSTGYRLDANHYKEFAGEVNQHTRLIRVPAKRLFAIVTDEDRFQAVLPEGTVLSQETQPPYRSGTIVRMRINHIFKLTWQSRVEEVLPAKLIRLTFMDGFFAGGTEIWEFAATAAGTRVTHTIIVAPRGVWRKIAWHLKVRLKHDRMVEQMLNNLEQVAVERQ